MPYSLVDLGPFTDSAAACLSELPVAATEIFVAELRHREAQNDVVAASLVIKRARAKRSPLTDIERELVAKAEAYVRSGVQPPALFASIRRPADQRIHRTMLSLADPGHGHLTVTLVDAELLDGVILHHEVISRCRGDGAPGPEIAPYRMINIRKNALLRLHAADDVPVSVYGGRPSYQIPIWHKTPSKGWTVTRAYGFDPVSPSHVAAATASAAFANGVADVKFYLGNLTAEQAIDFMARVKSAVDRDEARQTLSSQFNVNIPILDDRPSTIATKGRPVRLAKPAAIAQLSTELTYAGGWERVTLDSASANIPSRPVTEILGFDSLGSWVDQAHAVGLETYISGGICGSHIGQATRAGVDGVGIGFWIHHPGDSPGSVGELDADRIREAIRVRNEAERQVN